MQALENVHKRLAQHGNHAFDEDVMRMKHVLNSPLLRQLLAMQSSCRELNQKVRSAQGNTINDFEFSPEGGLVTISTRHLKLDVDRSSTSPAPVLTNTLDTGDLHERLLPVAQGRDMETIILSKPERGGLGFSVVGLKSENKGELGIFIQDVQANGIAARYDI